MKTDHECLIIVGQGGYTSSEGGRGRRMVTGPPFNKCLECSFEAVFSKRRLRLSRVFSRGFSVLVWHGLHRRKRCRRGTPVVDVTIGYHCRDKESIFEGTCRFTVLITEVWLWVQTMGMATRICLLLPGTKTSSKIQNLLWEVGCWVLATVITMYHVAGSVTELKKYRQNLRSYCSVDGCVLYLFYSGKP